MSTYSRKGEPVQQNTMGDGAEAAERPVNFDGFGQVLEMLKIADPAFRESLLRRLAARDIELARTLRADLMKAGL